MPVLLVERLEALSGYHLVYPPHDPLAARNPINYSHIRLIVGERSLSVLSRIGPAGLDYSGRSNKYAHHIVIDANERPKGGPAWLLSQPGFVQSAWEGEPRVLAEGRKPPAGDRPAGIATAWQSATGDAGWAGVLAESFLKDPARAVFVIFPPGMDLLPLFVEAIALLAPSRRWEVEFSTYFMTLPQGTACLWRGVVHVSPQADNASRFPNALIVDLSRTPAGLAEGGALVQLARTGQWQDHPVAAVMAPLPKTPKQESPTLFPRRAEAAQVSAQISQLAARSDHGLIPTPQHQRSVPTIPDSGGTGSTYHRRRRTWGLVAAIVAACLIPLVALAVVLRIEVEQLLGFNSKARRLIADASRRVEQKKVEEDARIEAPTAVAAGPAKERTKQEALSRPSDEPPKPPSSKHQEKTLEAPRPEKLPGGRENARAEAVPPLKHPAHPTQEREKALKPSFLLLEEPVSAVAESRQESITLRGAGVQIIQLELLGAGTELESTFTREPRTKAVVSAKRKVESGPGIHHAQAELATFDVSQGKPEIQFHWARQTSDSDRERLRDCVLVVTARELTEKQYFILRGEPKSTRLKTGFEMNDLKMSSSKGLTYRLAWDPDGNFKQTKGALDINDCRLVNGNERQDVHLTRRHDNSWATPGDDLSVRFVKAELLLEIQGEKPNELDKQIRNKEAEIKGLEADRSRIQDKGERQDADQRIVQLNERIDRVHENLRHLAYLKSLHSSRVKFLITWSIGKHRFDIVRSE
jgi:hypothetical protein